MDFTIPTDYQQYKQAVIDFARRELRDDVVARDASGTFGYELWQRCAAFGIQGLAAPAAFGGQAEKIDLMKSVMAMEGLGYGCRDNGLTLALNAQMWTVQVIIDIFGTDAQKEQFLRPLATGKAMACHALTEEQSGSDTFNMQTTATQVEGGYLLNGEKRLITLAPIADLALVFASSNPQYGKWGISAFLVELDREGVSRSPVRQKMGCRTVPFGELTFTDCFVPEANRLGKEGAGFSITQQSLEYDRCCILASDLGAMERQLEETIAYAQKRKQFGQPIGKFQSVSNRIADMKLRLETSRLLLYKMVWLKAHNKPCTLEASLLKLQLSESFVVSSLDAIRVHGGNGYLSEFEVERDLRDAVGGVLYAGTSDIHRNIVAKLMGL
ncbi:MAG: acyl-CoA dehydrogenase [Bacteroidetes bacterium]|nr:MAG: acyl-CoA dehydrogenase [Bacteroidota bacterium]